MKFPIDVLILDQHGRVVQITEGLLPYRILVWSPRYSQVVELPAGMVKKEAIAVGTVVSLRE